MSHVYYYFTSYAKPTHTTVKVQTTTRNRGGGVPDSAATGEPSTAAPAANTDWAPITGSWYKIFHENTVLLAKLHGKY